MTLAALGLAPRRPSSLYEFCEGEPCLICGSSPIERHHVEHASRSRKAGPLRRLTVMPLCARCHRDGRDSAHNRGKGWQARHGLDLEERRLDLYRRYAAACGWELPAGMEAEEAAAWLAALS